MAVRGRVQVTGQAGIIANIFSGVAVVQRNIRSTNRRFRTRGEARARQLAPKDTGFMASQTVGYLSPDELVWGVHVPEAPFEAAGLAYYPWFVHEGTRFMGARPYLLWTFEEMRTAYEREISASVRKGMQEIERRGGRGGGKGRR